MHSSKDNNALKNQKGQARNFSWFLSLFQGVKLAGENRWMGLCPAHADKKQSLSIRLAKDTILLKCHAGCQTPDILKAIGLTMSDLFLKVPRKIVATYHYHTAQGKLLFEVVRFQPKGFAQRRMVKGEWGVKSN